MRPFAWMIALHGLYDIVCGMTLLMGMTIPQSFMFRPRLTPYENFMLARCLIVAGLLRLLSPRKSGVTYCLDTICFSYLVLIGRVAFWRGMRVAALSLIVATLITLLSCHRLGLRRAGCAAKRAPAAYFA